ncbi:hypothetical protein [Fischerella thermalis]|nr:hypothetical protein [Fischerella thermalis]
MLCLLETLWNQNSEKEQSTSEKNAIATDLNLPLLLKKGRS